jgi:hypothetical protein
LEITTMTDQLGRPEEVPIVVVANAAKTAPKILARKLIDLIEGGTDPKLAGKELGLDRATLNQMVLSKQFQELLSTATFSADVQRAIVRAARLKMLGHSLATGMEAWTDKFGKTHAGDEGQLKIAAEMTKQIASDPEVGLTAAPQTTINLTFAKSSELLDKTEPLPCFETVEFLDGEDDGSRTGSPDGPALPAVAERLEVQAPRGETLHEAAEGPVDRPPGCDDD